MTSNSLVIFGFIKKKFNYLSTCKSLFLIRDKSNFYENWLTIELHKAYFKHDIKNYFIFKLKLVYFKTQ